MFQDSYLDFISKQQSATTERVLAETFQLEENTRYLPVTSENLVTLKTLPSTAELIEQKAPAGSLTEYIFTIRVGPENFISNGVVFRTELPFIVKKPLQHLSLVH